MSNLEDMIQREREQKHSVVVTISNGIVKKFSTADYKEEVVLKRLKALYPEETLSVVREVIRETGI